MEMISYAISAAYEPVSDLPNVQCPYEHSTCVHRGKKIFEFPQIVRERFRQSGLKP
jgi:hypothetical protein